MSDRNDRRTPKWFFDLCAKRYVGEGGFDLDAAANAENVLCPMWLGPGGVEEDALACDWNLALVPLNVWCNPPYGPAGTIPKWIAHARRQRDLYGVRTVMLLLNDPSTRWFQDVKRTEWVEDVPFRLAFGAPDGSTKGNTAMEPSCVVVIAPLLEKGGGE